MNSKISKEYDRDEILKCAPDFVQIANVPMQNKYIDYEIARRRVDECEDRFMRYTNDKQQSFTIDLKNVNIKGIMKPKGASDSDIADATEIRTKIMLPLIAVYNHARQKYLHAFDLHNKSGKALASLTPMLIDMFGSMLSVKDIIKTCKQKEGYDLSEAELTKFYNEHRSNIEARQAKYVSRSDKYRVATEAGRLEILNDILTDLYLKYEKYMKLDQDQRALTMEREIRNVLEQARKEIKGNQLQLTVDGKIDISATLHGADNITRTMRDVPINSIIIGLVAAKTGLNAGVLIHQLATSWYKDFNGFNKNILGQDKIQLPGDLIKSYDWGEMEELNKGFLNELQQKPDVEYTEYEDVKSADTKREILLQKLKAFRGKK